MEHLEFPHYRTGEINNASDVIAELPSIIKAIPVDYIKRQRWFGSKAKEIKGIHLYDAAPVSHNLPVYVMALIELVYKDANSEIYYFPIVIDAIDSLTEQVPPNSENVILEIQAPLRSLLVFDALQNEEFLRKKFQMVEASKRIDSMAGRFECTCTELLADSKTKQPPSTDSLRFMEGEQSNTSVIYGDDFVMKNFRRLANGTNPDLEIPLFLTTKTNFKNMPLVAGYIEYSRKDDFKSTIASLQNLIMNQGDGWKYTLEHLQEFYSFAIDYEAQRSSEYKVSPEMKQMAVRQFSNTYLQDARHLGEVTGELHNALTSNHDVVDFAPELITESEVRMWIEGIQSYISEVMLILSNKYALFPSHIQEQIRKVVASESFYLCKVEELSVFADGRTYKTRCHGDYHLGQVLKTADDWIIIDFEGEPARTPKERRAKNSTLKDIAGMLRSFNYAVYSKLFDFDTARKNNFSELEKWGRIWGGQVCEHFLQGYFNAALGNSISCMPASKEMIQKALTVFQLDKAMYELNYELNNRPTWIEVPLKYLLSLSN